METSKCEACKINHVDIYYWWEYLCERCARIKNLITNILPAIALAIIIIVFAFIYK
jgi:hypothetical protein